jgi:hypothetical protein
MPNELGKSIRHPSSYCTLGIYDRPLVRAITTKLTTDNSPKLARQLIHPPHASHNSSRSQSSLTVARTSHFRFFDITSPLSSHFVHIQSVVLTRPSTELPHCSPMLRTHDRLSNHVPHAARHASCVVGKSQCSPWTQCHSIFPSIVDASDQ